MTRLQWERLPESVRDAVQEKCGTVGKAESATAGIMPGVAARLRTETGSVFVKAIELGSPAAHMHEREEWANRVLPREAPTPDLLMSRKVGGWHVMVFEYVKDTQHADLTPGSVDLPAVLDTIAMLGSMLTPSPEGATPVSENVAALSAKARQLLERRRLDDAEPYEVALERFKVEQLCGDTLLHYDLSPGNLLVADGRVYVVDWSFAAQGAAWVECALLAPRLVEAGHSPAEVDELLGRIPAWREAGRDALPGLAALWTMFRLHKAMHGPEEHREARTRAAGAGRAWMLYLLTG